MQTEGFNPNCPIVAPMSGDKWTVTEEAQMAVRKMEALPTDLVVKGVPNPGDPKTKGDAWPEKGIECQWGEQTNRQANKRMDESAENK